jgi:hypothetical protein
MPRRPVFVVLTVLAVIAAAAHAWILRWTCDDAFISFRYAQHFAEGHGLVFNLDPNEPPVEGYTNFAWTMLLSLGVLLGCTDQALEHWSIALGVACHAGTVWLLAAMARRASGGRALVPIAALGYAAMHHAASLAPAGLETAMFTLLVTILLHFCFALRCVRDAWLMGFVGVLAALTRPDGAVPVAMAGLFVLHDAVRRRAPLLLVGYVVPFVLVLVPYLLWRHDYYGYWLPNTFYAKTGQGSYVPQGLPYVGDFVLCHWPLLTAFVALFVWWPRRPDPLATISPFLGRRPWAAIAAIVVPYLLFVVWVGGDFMFARFVLPVVPALLLAADLACQRWRTKWLPFAWACLFVVGFQLRIEPAGLDNPVQDVSDNRRISVAEIAPGITFADAFRSCGEYLQQLFVGLDVRLGIAGGHANLAYRSRVPVAIECAAGLTDAYIARIPVAPGGKRGHDRPWPLYPDYLVRRGMHFMLELSYGQGDAWRDIVFPSAPVPLPMRLVTWDRELMAEVRRRDPGIVVRDFEEFLDDYLRTMGERDRAQVARDYAAFRAFYFDHNEDAARRAAFEAALR